MLGKKAKSVDCPAIDGIIDEAEEVTGEVDDKDVLDAAIIAAGQAVEHYEITRYGSLIAWAKRLGRNDVGQGARADAERGEGGRQEADDHRREQGQPEGCELAADGRRRRRRRLPFLAGPTLLGLAPWE